MNTTTPLPSDLGEVPVFDLVIISFLALIVLEIENLLYLYNR